MPRIAPAPSSGENTGRVPWAVPDNSLKAPWTFRTKEKVQCLCEGGRWCTRENPERQRGGNAIPGLHCSWVGQSQSILAMARPWQDNLAKFSIIDAFVKHNIGMVLNLQEVGEHDSCGPGNLKHTGFSYDPDAFMSARIGFYNFSWQDMGTPDLQKAMDIVQVMDFVTVVQARKIAVHCHAGLGRTGLAIACHMLYSLGYSSRQAVEEVRRDRQGALQTRQQEQFVYVFEQFLAHLRCLFHPKGLASLSATPAGSAPATPLPAMQFIPGATKEASTDGPSALAPVPDDVKESGGVRTETYGHGLVVVRPIVPPSQKQPAQQGKDTAAVQPSGGLGADRYDVPWDDKLHVLSDKFSKGWLPQPPRTYQEAMLRQSRLLHGPERRAYRYLHRFTQQAVFAVMNAAQAHTAPPVGQTRESEQQIILTPPQSVQGARMGVPTYANGYPTAAPATQPPPLPTAPVPMPSPPAFPTPSETMPAGLPGLPPGPMAGYLAPAPAAAQPAQLLTRRSQALDTMAQDRQTATSYVRSSLAAIPADRPPMSQFAQDAVGPGQAPAPAALAARPVPGLPPFGYSSAAAGAPVQGRAPGRPGPVGEAVCSESDPWRPDVAPAAQWLRHPCHPPLANSSSPQLPPPPPQQQQVVPGHEQLGHSPSGGSSSGGWHTGGGCGAASWQLPGPQPPCPPAEPGAEAACLDARTSCSRVSRSRQAPGGRHHPRPQWWLSDPSSSPSPQLPGSFSTAPSAATRLAHDGLPPPQHGVQGMQPADVAAADAAAMPPPHALPWARHSWGLPGQVDAADGMESAAMPTPLQHADPATCPDTAAAGCRSAAAEPAAPLVVSWPQQPQGGWRQGPCPLGEALEHRAGPSSLMATPRNKPHLSLAVAPSPTSTGPAAARVGAQPVYTPTRCSAATSLAQRRPNAGCSVDSAAAAWDRSHAAQPMHTATVFRAGAVAESVEVGRAPTMVATPNKPVSRSGNRRSITVSPQHTQAVPVVESFAHAVACLVADGLPVEQYDEMVLQTLAAQPGYAGFVGAQATAAALQDYGARVRRAANFGDLSLLSSAPIAVALAAVDSFLSSFAAPCLSETAMRVAQETYQALPYETQQGPEPPQFAAAMQVVDRLPASDQELLLLFSALLRHIVLASGGAGCEEHVLVIGKWVMGLLLGRSLAASPAVEEPTLSFLWFFVRNDVAYACLILAKKQRADGRGNASTPPSPGPMAVYAGGQQVVMESVAYPPPPQSVTAEPQKPSEVAYTPARAVVLPQFPDQRQLPSSSLQAPPPPPPPMHVASVPLPGPPPSARRPIQLPPYGSAMAETQAPLFAPSLPPPPAAPPPAYALPGLPPATRPTLPSSLPPLNRGSTGPLLAPIYRDSSAPGLSPPVVPLMSRDAQGLPDGRLYGGQGELGPLRPSLAPIPAAYVPATLPASAQPAVHDVWV